MTETTPNYQPVAPAYARRYAAAQALAQDPDRLCPGSETPRRLSRPLAGHRHGRGPAALPALPRRSWQLADHVDCDDYRSEVLFRCQARSCKGRGEDAAGAGTAQAAGDIETRGGGGSPPRPGQDAQRRLAVPRPASAASVKPNGGGFITEAGWILVDDDVAVGVRLTQPSLHLEADLVSLDQRQFVRQLHV